MLKDRDIYQYDIVNKSIGFRISILFIDYILHVREAFNKKKNKLCGNFPQGGGEGFEPDPHFFEKNKVGLKMCFKSF